MASVINRNDRRREQTRQKLVAAATCLFISKGYNETTIDEVCAEADVAKVTFYYHFQSKDDIVREIKAAATQEVFCGPARMLDDGESAVNVLRSLTMGIGSWTESNWRLLEVFLSQKFQHVAAAGTCADNEPNSLVNFLVRIIEHGKRNGEFRASADTAEMASFIALAIFNQQVLWMHNQRQTSLIADFERCLDFVLNGVRSSATPGVQPILKG